MAEPIEVLITLPFTEELTALLRAVSPRLNIQVRRAHHINELPDDIWPRLQVLYTNRVLPPPEKAPALRWVQFHYAGVDHALDLPLLHRPGLLATTLSGAAAPQVAEYILGMFLALGHRLPDLGAAQRKIEWPRDRWERFSPLELRGSTIGIIGYGSIGRELARLAAPFGANILGAKRDAMRPADTGYIPPGLGDPGGDLARRLYPAQALRSMLRECDFVVVAAPLTPASRGMVDAEALAAMKPTAFLVDISRGGIVDHAALYLALKDRRLAGAALDVFPEEPLPAEHPLWKLPNVIITPHISGNSPLYDRRAAELFAENLRRYIEGRELLNLVDLERGY